LENVARNKRRLKPSILRIKKTDKKQMQNRPREEAGCSLERERKRKRYR